MTTSTITSAFCHFTSAFPSTQAHGHQDIEERAGNLDYAGAHFVDKIEVDLVVRQVPQWGHEKFRIERDRKITPFIHHWQRLLSFANVGRGGDNIDVALRESELH